MDKPSFENAEDLLAEPDFVEWLLFPTGKRDHDWTNWMNAQPHHRRMVEEATELYKTMMRLQEPVIDPRQTETQLLKLMMMIQGLGLHEDGAVSGKDATERKNAKS